MHLPRRVSLAVALAAASSSAIGLATMPTASAGPSAASSATNNPPTVVRGIDVDRTTIPQLEADMNHHRLTSVQLVRFYLNRISKLNPLLNAVISVDPTAVREARNADRARANGDKRVLLGIPVIVKDNVDTTNMPTTAGSFALAGTRPTQNAFIVRQLKAAGAIVIGKANLSEWANYRSTHSSSGWSGVGGQTNNPYALDRNPCGSSSGSAVAAAADLATVAVGTETDGSVVCPSGQNGDVGIKPSLGLVSRSGIVPISEQQDTAGPIARNVTDAAVLLGVLQGFDPNDPITRAAIGRPTDYTKFLDPNALKGARIGIWRQGNFGLSPKTDAVMNKAIARLRALGAVVVNNTNIPFLNQFVYPNENSALESEFKHDIGVYLRTRPGGPQTLQDLITFDRQHAKEEMQWFGQDIFIASEHAPSITSSSYLEARRTATIYAQRGINQTMRKYHLDAILAPTNSPAWTTDLINGDHFMLGSSTPAAVSGFANVTVPAGYSHGLPIGMSLVGGKFDEPQLISLAYAWEQATHIRHKPTLRATVGESTELTPASAATHRATS